MQIPLNAAIRSSDKGGSKEVELERWRPIVSPHDFGQGSSAGSTLLLEQQLKSDTD